MPSASRRVIREYYLLAGLYTLSAALIWGVNTLFLLDAGLDILEVFIANAAFTAGMVVFEIPTGVLADTRGRRVSFLLSVAILGVTTVAYVWVAHAGGGLVAFAVVSVLMGLGFTFYSGAVEAWLVDALRATAFEGPLDSIFARGSMITGAAMLIGTVSGGVLGDVNLALPYLTRAAMLAAVFAVAYAGMHDLGFDPRTVRLLSLHREMMHVARESVAYGWQAPSVRLLILVSFFQFGFLNWAWHAWQPYFLDLLGRDAVWVAGVIAALISLSMIAGNAMVEWIGRFCTRRTTLFVAGSVAFTAAAVGVGLVESFWWAVGLFLVVTFAMGLMGPAKQAYMHEIIPSRQRATVVSFDSLLGNAGGIGSQAGLGYLARVRSLADGYVVGGLMTLAVVPLLGLLRARRDQADYIVGRECGTHSPSAGQGLPEAGLVDAVKRRPSEVMGGASRP